MEEKSSEKAVRKISKAAIKNINKPFEVCLSPVLPNPGKLHAEPVEAKEKVGDKPGLTFRSPAENVLNNLAGINRKKNERNHW